MSDLQEDQYLAPHFNTASLRVVDLRNLLHKHGISHPSVCKKAELVKIFDQELKPKGPEILRKKSQVKPSSRGIVIVGQSPSDDNHDEDHDKLDQKLVDETKPTTRQRRKKTISSASVTPKDESETEAESVPATRPSRSRRPRRSLSQIEAEKELSTKPIKTSKSRKSESSLDDTNEPFSDYNPFQSGNEMSPDISSSKQRRKSQGPETTIPTSPDRKRRSTSVKDILRKKSLEGFHSPDTSPKTSPESVKTSHQLGTINIVTPPLLQRMLQAKDTHSEKKLSNKKRRNGTATTKRISDVDIEPSEEFAPDQILDYMDDNNYKKSVSSTSLPSHRSRSWILWFSIILLIFAYGGWWREEKLRLGYLDIGEQPDTPSQDTLPLIEFLRPKPNPCPSHGICNNGQFIKCEKDYVIQPHPFSFGGFLPFSVQCRPDTEKLTRITAIADRMNDLLREKEGMVQCGMVKLTPDKTGIASRGLSEQQLKEMLKTEKNPGISDGLFNEYLDAALTDLETRRDEIESITEILTRGDIDHEIGHVQDQNIKLKYYTSTNPKMDLGCRLRLESARLAYRIRIELASLIALTLFIIYIRRRLAKNRAEQTQIAQLVQLALDKLAEQERLHYTDPVQHPYPYMAIAHLRDYLLSDIHSPARRTKLWMGVQRVVEGNANVRTRQVELRGDWQRVWEWIGVSGPASSPSVMDGKKVYPSLE